MVLSEDGSYVLKPETQMDGPNENSFYRYVRYKI